MVKRLVTQSLTHYIICVSQMQNSELEQKLILDTYRNFYIESATATLGFKRATSKSVELGGTLNLIAGSQSYMFYWVLNMSNLQ